MADRQIYQLTARTLALTDVIPTQDAAGSAEAGKNTITDIVTLMGTPPRTVKKSISSAEILTMGSTPISLVAAQGSGTFIQPISVFVRLNYVSAAYATNVQLVIKVGTFDTLVTIDNVLDSGGDKYARSAIGTNTSAAGTGMLNAACSIYVAVGNPTAGSGTLDVYLTYTVITL